MSIQAILPNIRNQIGPGRLQSRARGNSTVTLPFRVPAHPAEEQAPHREAELFYLQKQIQSRTPMVILLEDGERLEGCIEWYDRNSLKVRGKTKALVYKSAIKYMFKVGDSGQQPGF
jgi:sRNA-binding regulator protein Hfq